MFKTSIKENIKNLSTLKQYNKQVYIVNNKR